MRRSVQIRLPQTLLGLGIGLLLVTICSVQAGDRRKTRANNARNTAAAVDRLLLEELARSKTSVAPQTSDEGFLRRVSFDLAGTMPSATQVTLFGLDPDPNKRVKLIDRLLASDEFATTWAAYWKDVIFSRATDPRAQFLSGPAFQQWMTDKLKGSPRWNAITTELLTATGESRENGATALFFAHNADPKEMAAETARIFLGIQIQCANCHDHPSDKWTRKEFHQFAAYFPRVRIQRKRTDGKRRTFEVVSFDQAQNARRRAFSPQQLLRRFDKNGDKKITRKEVAKTRFARVFNRILNRADTNKDGALSLAELKKMPQPRRRNRNSEYFMPDLKNPTSRGQRMDPVFFVSSTTAGTELKDLQRRGSLAKSVTSQDDPWFARAFVNRIWGEMLGRGFYMPIDDLGPSRTPEYPQVLDRLCAGFVANDYDIKWLYRTIANTQAYQRQIRAKDASNTTPSFASATPTRLRADQIYNAVTQVLGVQNLGGRGNTRRRGPYRRASGGRAAFATLFGFDPSTPQDDIIGKVPQALFMMNSPTLSSLLRGRGETRLGRLLKQNKDNNDAIDELYLLVLARAPSKKEIRICTAYIARVGNRQEAFEDLMWTLMNSSEFISKR